ncbi:MAG: tRNA pseudouridine(55) synthase TruB, partial [Lawsonibacter sp.]
MPSGIIIIDKPAGWTSMDVCAKLRGIFREKRIGHAGTLDPMATGVLPVFVGRATRAVEFASEGDKEYVAGLVLGIVTNTQDTTGEVLRRQLFSGTRRDLEAVLEQFRGDILQLPPMYSAIKINGKKLYELARKGREVERQLRPVTIHSLTLEDGSGQDEFVLRVRCSKGTYIRTLCHDIGQALGCGGAMSSLRRTMAAGFTLDDSVSLDQVQQAGDPASLLLPVDAYFAQRPILSLRPEGEKKVRNGMALD